MITRVEMLTRSSSTFTSALVLHRHQNHNPPLESPSSLQVRLRGPITAQRAWSRDSSRPIRAVWRSTVLISVLDVVRREAARSVNTLIEMSVFTLRAATRGKSHFTVIFRTAPRLVWTPIHLNVSSPLRYRWAKKSDPHLFHPYQFNSTLLWHTSSWTAELLNIHNRLGL